MDMFLLKVETGDVRQAGTSARVYVVLHGGKGGTQTSGKIWLTDGDFKRARTDEFNVEVAQMLSPLTKIDVGHDNSGVGAGWYCHQVSTLHSFISRSWFCNVVGQ